MKYYILLVFWNCVLFNKLIDINRYYYSLRETIWVIYGEKLLLFRKYFNLNFKIKLIARNHLFFFFWFYFSISYVITNESLIALICLWKTLSKFTYLIASQQENRRILKEINHIDKVSQILQKFSVFLSSNPIDKRLMISDEFREKMWREKIRDWVGIFCLVRI